MNEKALTRVKMKKVSFDRYKETRDGRDYLEYAHARKMATGETRKAVRDFEKEIAKLSKKEPKTLYKYVSSRLNTGMTRGWLALGRRMAQLWKMTLRRQTC